VLTELRAGDCLLLRSDRVQKGHRCAEGDIGFSTAVENPVDKYSNSLQKRVFTACGLAE
jgi:hypothetical protein